MTHLVAQKRAPGLHRCARGDSLGGCVCGYHVLFARRRRYATLAAAIQRPSPKHKSDHQRAQPANDVSPQHEHRQAGGHEPHHRRRSGHRARHRCASETSGQLVNSPSDRALRTAFVAWSTANKVAATHDPHTLTKGA